MNSLINALIAQPTPLANEVSELVYGEGAFLALFIILALATYIASKGYLGRFFSGIGLMLYGYDISQNVATSEFHLWVLVFTIFIGGLLTLTGWNGET